MYETDVTIAPRSPHWAALRATWLKDHPTCAACGRSDFLEVHHKLPFHLFRDLELDPANLMTLCEAPNWSCHLKVGHLGNWKTYRQNVVHAASLVLTGLKLA